MTADTTDTGRAEPDNRTCGLHVWRCARDGAWRMDGIYGQFGIMLPASGPVATPRYGSEPTLRGEGAMRRRFPFVAS
jgi:hypothetical protein